MKYSANFKCFGSIASRRQWERQLLGHPVKNFWCPSTSVYDYDVPSLGSFPYSWRESLHSALRSLPRSSAFEVLCAGSGHDCKRNIEFVIHSTIVSLLNGGERFLMWLTLCNQITREGSALPQSEATRMKEWRKGERKGWMEEGGKEKGEFKGHC